uniref:Uncharacterized protein n=1 Tax=Leviviridae sp. TaxID=2027243 RepID=A0A514D2M7_9VIRU|nr:MAG: hypothetical protein H2RhizoLitter49830_000004 [Leviviridae sp.]
MGSIIPGDDMSPNLRNAFKVARLANAWWVRCNRFAGMRYIPATLIDGCVVIHDVVADEFVGVQDLNERLPEGCRQATLFS